MLVSILPVPFARAARQRQYEAVSAALAAEPAAPATVLLGNVAAFTDLEADALLIRPNCLALLVLLPQGGQLAIPALAYGTWQLDGRPLPGRYGADNPFAHYRERQADVRAWVAEQLGYALPDVPPCQGLALFEEPLTFGPEVEAQLNRHAEHEDFQLVATAGGLPSRLPVAGHAARLAEADLLAWANQLAAHSRTMPALPAASTNYLALKLRQLWRWLGAEDIPADPYYGAPLPAPRPPYQVEQEQARLQQLREELQAELHQQRQEAAAREAARTQELTQLRQQLAQAGRSAAERQVEQQVKSELEASLRTTRAELAARSHELAARIQQLEQLMGQLRAVPRRVPAKPPAAAPASWRPIRPPQLAFRRLRQAERWAVLVLGLAGASAGSWALARLGASPGPRLVQAGSPRSEAATPPLEVANPGVVYIVDSTLASRDPELPAAASPAAALTSPAETLPAPPLPDSLAGTPPATSSPAAADTMGASPTP